MATEKMQRNTRQRQMILEELQNLSTHPTASELYAIVRRKMPKISLGTVYRNLDFLVRNQIIRKIEMGGAETRFDADCHRHHHIRCMECGRLDDLMDMPVKFKKKNYVHSNGYEITGCHLEYLGICPDCRKIQ